MWESLLVALGGQAALLVVLGWLARSFGSQLLAKDLEKFKNDLAAASTQATERLKHELQMAAKGHEVRFSKLHERRAKVVAEIYGLLVEVEWAAQSLVAVVEVVGEKSKREKYVIAFNKAGDFFQCFEKNRIYLPKELCDELERFVREMRFEVIKVGTFLRIEHPNEHMVQEQAKVWARAGEYMQKEAPAAKAALEMEFRRLLGAS
jgi:hypothetical protein